ncbi:hypothetical protein IAR55_003542 [Kwoniella newhampshirensis]|uniref:Major facilitator superfamily (MFS) profile domain-containing protein n=1 Tax=Kwoniella newhampshirensis TaxID=1651941 RepID=A0AAW0YX38_9TREE
MIPSGEDDESTPLTAHETEDGVSPTIYGLSASKSEELCKRAGELAGLVSDDTLVGGKTFTELSLYEKKSVLINRELDLMGMGRYQWCIFFLCGFGYFLDLCWAQAFGLVASAIQQEMGITDARISDLSASFNSGLMIGAFTWGMLVDILGRRWCFNLTCAISTVFGFLFSAPSSYGAICFLAAMIGLGVGGNVPIDATITLEFLPTKNRYLLAALSTFQPIGVVVSSLISLALIPRYSCDPKLLSCKISEAPCCSRADNMGWRYTMLLLGFFTLAIFIARFVIFKFRESPKFLLVQGHDAHALDVLHSIASFNGMAEPGLNMDDFQALDFVYGQTSRNKEPAYGLRAGNKQLGTKELAEKVAVGGVKRVFGHLKGLFGQRIYVWLFIAMAVAYMSLFWAFSIAGYFLPLILRAKGVDTGASITQTYTAYVWIYLPSVSATIAASYLMEVPRVGRKWGMVVSAGLMGIALALYQLVNSRSASIGFNAMEYWFQSLYAALLYAYTPEAFPAQFRGSTSGMLSTLGRIASVLAPVAARNVYHGSSSPGVLWLSAGGAWVSMLAIACLPYDTTGKQAF